MRDLLKSKDWLELKSLLIDEFVEKPYKMNTTGKTAETIAIDYKAHELASKKVKNFIAKIERTNRDVQEKVTLDDFR